MDGVDSFNEAEKLLAADKPAEAVKKYDQAIAKVSKGWQQRLVRYRRLAALDAAGEINRAVEEWMGLVEEHEASKASLAARPTNLAPKGSEDNRKAILLLEARLNKSDSVAHAYRRAMQDLLKDLYRRQGNAREAAKLIEEAEKDHHARQEQAEKAKPKTSSRRPITDAALNRTMSDASTLIEQGKSDTSLSAGARREILAKAERSLDLAVERVRNADDLPAVLLLLGRAQMAMVDVMGDSGDHEKLKEAGLNFMRVVVYFSKSAEAPEALFEAGRVSEQFKNRVAAANCFEMFLKEYPDHELAGEVKSRLEEIQ
jgi:tetratricopeptide (TPR) repeat protein